MNKEIRFSAKDTGVSNLMQRLRADSKRLHEDMMRDSQTATGSQREAIKHYEQQIRLLDQRNRLEREQARFSLTDRYESAMRGAKPEDQAAIREKYRAGMAGIDKDAQVGKMQVDILRELLQTTKDGMSHDTKEGVKDRMHNERLAQDEMRSSERQESRPERESAVMAGVRGVMYARGLSNTLGQGEAGAQGMMDTITGGLMMSGNPMAMVAGGILDGLGSLFTLYSTQLKMMQTPAVLAGTNGEWAIENEYGYGGSNRIENIGMDREEYLQRLPQSMRSYGKGISEEQAMRDIYAEKAFGLNTELISQMQGLTRTMGDYNEANVMAADIHQKLLGTGMWGGSDEADFSRMAEIVGTVVGMQQERFMRTGLQSGFNERLSMMVGLEKMGGAWKDDQYKRATLQQLESGASTIPNKMVHAMKLREMKKIMPGANAFELSAGIESGDPRMIEPLMQGILSQTDDDTLAMQRVYDMFGGKLSKTNTAMLVRKMRSGQSITGELGSSSWSTGDYQDFMKRRSEEFTPEGSAAMMRLWNDTVAEATKIMGSFSKGLSDLLNLM